MNPLEKRCIDYCLVDTYTVNQYLPLGFEPLGQAFYHPKHQCCFQVLVKYIHPNRMAIPHLTNKERECLSCLMQGFSIKQMADELCCGEKNVDRLLKRLRDKFEVKKTSLLIKKAMEAGFKAHYDW